MMRKLVRKLMMLDPGYRKAFFLEQKLDRMCDELKTAIELAGKKNGIDAAMEAIDSAKVALFRSDIRCRWQVLDALDSILYPPSTPVKCLVCGHEAPKSTYETKVSECIFGGGRLERFVCPDCGCIFGPLKMMSLSQEQLGEEYKQSYGVYSESPTEFLELDAFRALGPTRDGVYLNYGAGAWNKTTEHLRCEGFKVYDYEPYAPISANEWVFHSVDEMNGMKFDGIFSNDLIEHLREPVKDMRSMSSLLKPRGMMAHCTGCYDYAWEFTRFHMFFLTGTSLYVLAERAGLVAELQDYLYPGKLPARVCLFGASKR